MKDGDIVAMSVSDLVRRTAARAGEREQYNVGAGLDRLLERTSRPTRATATSEQRASAGAGRASTPKEFWDLVPAHESLSPDRVAELVTALLGGPVDPDTLRLLVTAGRGEPALTMALVIAGRMLGDLAPAAEGGADARNRWTWRDAAGVTANLKIGVITVVDLLTLRTDTVAEPSAVAMRLTPRETDVLELLHEGLTARAIAHRLDLSTRTVSRYQEKLYRKLGTSDRLTTVLVAQRLGLVVSRSANDGPQRR